MTVTELLEVAIAKLKTLPTDKQDSLAKLSDRFKLKWKSYKKNFLE
jgi:hypothetical protein